MMLDKYIYLLLRNQNIVLHLCSHFYVHNF